MLFNSLDFLIFFPLVTIAYFCCQPSWRWMLLFLASCFFYMHFIPVYVLILFLLIAVDYTAAIYIADSEGARRKVFLLISILTTCLVLAIFKYFNFFSENIEHIAKFFHLNYPKTVLQLILPIGLSFHTFQSLSYVIEVYYRRQVPERHLGIYACYVMFYPQLVAGPIERPQHLLGQFRQVHVFSSDNMITGLKIMLWGFFKKIVIADRLAPIVDHVYKNPTSFDGFTLMFATVCFAFQIYCDFSGYSDIARGAAKTMGFDLMRNFQRPYLATSISDFWRRWHISLSTWFRDYVYIPLGGNKCVPVRHYFNLMITFLLSGLWHGANWTYLWWGGLNGFYFICGHMLSATCQWILAQTQFELRFPIMLRLFRVIGTFVLICIGWVFFRSQNIDEAFYILTHMTNVTGNSIFLDFGSQYINISCAVIALLMIIHVIEERHGDWLDLVSRFPLIVRWLIYYAFIIMIFWVGVFQSRQFIYFQF